MNLDMDGRSFGRYRFTISYIKIVRDLCNLFRFQFFFWFLRGNWRCLLFPVLRSGLLPFCFHVLSLSLHFCFSLSQCLFLIVSFDHFNLFFSLFVFKCPLLLSSGLFFKPFERSRTFRPVRLLIWNLFIFPVRVAGVSTHTPSESFCRKSKVYLVDDLICKSGRLIDICCCKLAIFLNILYTVEFERRINVVFEYFTSHTYHGPKSKVSSLCWLINVNCFYQVGSSCFVLSAINSACDSLVLPSLYVLGHVDLLYFTASQIADPDGFGRESTLLISNFKANHVNVDFTSGFIDGLA